MQIMSKPLDEIISRFSLITQEIVIIRGPDKKFNIYGLLHDHDFIDTKGVHLISYNWETDEFLPGPGFDSPSKAIQFISNQFISIQII